MFLTDGFSRRSFLKAGALSFIGSFISQNKNDLPDQRTLKGLIAQEAPLVWLFTGDSVTQGAHHTYGRRCYPEIFAEHIRWEMRRLYDFVINTAINGTNTSYLLAAFDRNIMQFKPSVVSLMYGINDCQEPTLSTTIFQSNLEKLVTKVRTIGAIPILHSPNAIDMEGVKKMKTASRHLLPCYVEIIREVAKRNQIILVDHWRQWSERGIEQFNRWLDDPLHPNAEGHVKIARLMFTELSIFSNTDFTCTAT